MQVRAGEIGRGMEYYRTKKLIPGPGGIAAEVPGSKSITNRALILAALSSGECRLSGALFSDDSRAVLSCLESLGFYVEADEGAKEVVIRGLSGDIPDRGAEIDVRSAGTAARFLTVMLAFAGGKYTLRSSPQMEKRPMRPLLDELRKAGVRIGCLKNDGCFPFVLESDGIREGSMSIDTDVSSQFASAIMLCASVARGGLSLTLTGGRTGGAYIAITERMLGQFGIRYEKDGPRYRFLPGQSYALPAYAVEPDFSAADYFYAMGALLGTRAEVKGIRLSSMQGDRKFLHVLEGMGCRVFPGREGIALEGPGKLSGVSVNMNDFSDQALTLAAIAPFASSPVEISGIGHIRRQECDRIRAMSVNLSAMGVRTEEREDGITVFPCEEIRPAEIETFGDHRVAMSFAVAGTKCGNLAIGNPGCCAKTFENFFGVLDGLYNT